jgi:hypothetical protein
VQPIKIFCDFRAFDVFFFIEAASKVQVDPDAIEKLKIMRDDFMYALEHDVKPAFGHAAEQIEQYLRYGILSWGDPVTRILEDGDLLIQQARSEDSRGLVSVLLEGTENANTLLLNSRIVFISIKPRQVPVSVPLEGGENIGEIDKNYCKTFLAKIQTM